MSAYRISAIVFYLALLISVYSFKGEFILWLENPNSGSWPIVLMICILVGMVPIIPFAWVSGMLGIKYGLWGGSGMSLIASTIAAILTYWIFKSGGGRNRKQVIQTRLTKWNEQIRNRAFLFILIGRMLPFIPAALINSYAGLLKLPMAPFVSATVLGKIPTMLVFAFFGVSIIEGSLYWIPVLLMYCGFLGVVYMIYTRLFN